MLPLSGSRRPADLSGRPMEILSDFMVLVKVRKETVYDVHLTLADQFTWKHFN
jgi:hypothetical protein